MSHSEAVEALAALPPNQATAAELIAFGSSVTDAAQVAGVRRETVSRWSGTVAFSRAVRAVRNAALRESLHLATGVRLKALRLLDASLDEGEADPLAVIRVLGPPDPPPEPALSQEGRVRRLLASVEEIHREEEA